MIEAKEREQKQRMKCRWEYIIFLINESFRRETKREPKGTEITAFVDPAPSQHPHCPIRRRKEEETYNEVAITEKCLSFFMKNDMDEKSSARLRILDHE